MLLREALGLCNLVTSVPAHLTREVPHAFEFRFNNREYSVSGSKCQAVQAFVKPAPARSTGAKRVARICAQVASDNVSLDSRSKNSFDFLESTVAGPNKKVLDAQQKICTGPLQTKPLDEMAMREVLETVLKSVRGELPPEERVSLAQMGALFSAMTLRAMSFPPATQWSEGETKVLNELWPELRRILPSEVVFLADPEGVLFGNLVAGRELERSSGRAQRRLIGCLREVLGGGHLGYEECLGLLRDVIPSVDHGTGKEEAAAAPGEDESVSEALVAALLICQRMSRETDRELKAYCFAFDDDAGPAPVVNVRSLTHYGDPYDGATRHLRVTLFVAAVRACYGESSVLHGVAWMPPKAGVTEELMLQHMGAATSLSMAQAARLIEDPEIGFAYISQREAQPSLFPLTRLRLHLRKRPPLATSEKVQRFIKVAKGGREAMVAGYYHEGYEEPILMLMRRRNMEAGLVVKGEEGGLSLTTAAPRAPSKGRPINYVSGFRPLDTDPPSPSPRSGDKNDQDDDDDARCVGPAVISREAFSSTLAPSDFGFETTPSPQMGRSVSACVEAGLEALRGQKGPIFDRIVFNAALQDHLLKCAGAEDVHVAIARAKDAIESGKALKRLERYIEQSQSLLGKLN